MTNKQIIILYQGDYNKHWSIVDEDHLNKLLTDGSLKEGDIIIYPDKIVNVKNELKCVEEVSE